MIKSPTLKEFEAIYGFEAMVRVVGMQSILHSTRITEDLAVDGNFSRTICDRFASLLGEDDESARTALAGVLACEEYDSRVSFEGLGGCVKLPLQQLVERHEAEVGSAKPEAGCRQR